MHFIFYDNITSIIGLPNLILFLFVVLERIISFPSIINFLFISLYSGYSLYSNSSISKKVESPEQGIAKFIF